MKTIFKILLVQLMILNIAFAQEKLTAGIIKYDITYPEMDMDNQMAAMMPKDAILYFNENSSRMEVKSGFGNNVTIADGKNRVVYTLFDMAGDKFVVKMTEAEMKKEAEKAAKPEITHLDDTKTVAGYTCKKALLKMKDKDQEFISTVFYTDAIKTKNGNWYQNQYSGIDGMMLEFDMNQNGMNMKMTAKEVKKEKPDDDMFTVPAGYKEMTLDEMKQKYGGGDN